MRMQWPARSGGLLHRALDDDAVADKLPQRDEEFSRQGDDRRLLPAAVIALHALLEPEAQLRRRLMPEPQPRELDHGGAQPRVARLGHALLVLHGSALPRRRRQPGVGCHLPPVAEAAEQTFRPEDGGELRADPLQLRQKRRWRRSVVARGLEQSIPLRLYRLQLHEEEFQSVEFAADLRLQVGGQGAAVAGRQLFQPLAPVTMQGLVVGDALGEQQPLDPVDVLHPLCHQRLALAAEPAPVLLLRGRRETRTEAASTTWLSMPSRSSTRCTQKPSRPASWMTMAGKVLPVRACAFARSLASWPKSPTASPPRTECLDIFSPPPGDSEVISQLERESSRDTKTAPSLTS